MDSINNHLLRQTENSVYEIRKEYNLHEPERLREAIDILEEWVKKQTHFLNRDLSRDYYDRTLITCKGSVEKAKKRIDRMCTLRSLLPKFFTSVNVRIEFPDMLDTRGIIPLPNLTEDFYRVIITRCSSQVLKPSHYLQFYQFSIIASEYAMKHDYTSGFIMIYDLTNVDIMDTLSKLNVMEFHQFLTIIIEGYGARIKKIVLISNSKYIELLVKTVKQFLSEKIGNRIQVISNMEDLTSFVPSKILPKDFGGAEVSSDELEEQFLNALCSEDHIEHMKMVNKAGTDESLRISNKIAEDFIGIPGSFRTLTVD